MAKRKAASSETSSSSGADGAKSTKAELIRQAAKEIGKPVRRATLSPLSKRRA